MEFEDALKALKDGMIVTNENWNGKDQYIFMQRGYPEGVPANKNTAEALHIPEGEVVKVSPYIMMKNAAGALVPWVPSSGDLFSDGWINTGPI